MNTSNNLNTSYDSNFSADFNKLKPLSMERLPRGFIDFPYSSDNAFHVSTDLFDGIISLAIIMFAMVNNNSMILLKTAKTLNTRRSAYSKLLLTTEQLNHAIDTLKDFSAKLSGDPKAIDPTTASLLSYEDWLKKKLGTSHEWNWGKTGHPGDMYRYVNTHNPFIGKVEYFELIGTYFYYFPINEKSNHDWKYLGNEDDFKDKYEHSTVRTSDEFVLSEEELQGIASTIKILQPSSDVTVDKLRNPKIGIPLSKLKLITNDAQQRLAYMNSVNVQQGGLIQTAENNFQLITQLGSAVISVIKTVLGSIAQRL